MQSNRLSALFAPLALPMVIFGCSANADDDGGTNLVDPPILARPPVRPSGAATAEGPEAVFVVSRFYLESLPFEGLSSTAWEDLGYDRDSMITVDDFEEHCRPAGGASPSIAFPDGAGGIDNGFGRNVVPMLRLLLRDSDDFIGTLEDRVNAGLDAGESGLIIRFRALGDGNLYDNLDTYVYQARAALDGSWQPEPDSLVEPDASDLALALDSGKLRFVTAYMRDNEWVSDDIDAANGVMQLRLMLGELGYIDLKLYRPLLSLVMSPNRDSATRGVLSGVLSIEEAVAEAQRFLGATDQSFCQGTALAGWLNQVRQSADIMLNGTQDPTRTCDGLSIGLGFDARRVSGVTGVLEPRLPIPDPCAPQEPL